MKRFSHVVSITIGVLAVCLLGGCGGPSERETALRTKAESGDGQALLELGWAYDFGDDDPNVADEAKPYVIPGIHKDQNQARRLIEKAALKGNVRAMAITSTNDLFARNYSSAVYWAGKAMDGDPANKPLAQTLVTIALSDPAGAYTVEQRQAILTALTMDKKQLEQMVLSHDTGTEAYDIPLETPATDPAIEKAKNASVDYLCKRCFDGKRNFFEITNAEGTLNDHERDNTSYSITVYLEVRFQGPYGMLKRDASFACDAQGNVVAPLSLPEIAP